MKKFLKSFFDLFAKVHTVELLDIDKKDFPTTLKNQIQYHELVNLKLVDMKLIETGTFINGYLYFKKF